MADTLSLLSVVAFTIAGISLAAAVFFWFFFKISSVIGDLSGKNAKRSIETMRETNEKAGNKIYRGSSGEMHGKPEAGAGTGILTENRTEGEETERTELLTGNEKIIPDMQDSELLREEETTERLKAGAYFPVQ